MGHLVLTCGGVLTILKDTVPLIFAHVIAGIGAKCLISSLHVSYCLYGVLVCMVLDFIHGLVTGTPYGLQNGKLFGNRLWWPCQALRLILGPITLTG